MIRQLKITHSITYRSSKIYEKYMNELRTLPLLNDREESALFELVKNGDEEAVQQIALANLRFVVSVAKQYHRPGGPLTLLDLVSAGNIGLIHAVKKFDPSRGFRFISYAVWWIRQAIMAELTRHRNIVYAPANIVRLAIALGQSEDEYFSRNEQEGLPEQFQEECGSFDPAFVKRSTQRSLSLDQPSTSVEGDGGHTLLAVLVDESASEAMAAALDEEDNKFKVAQLLKKLPVKYRDVIIRRYGLNGADPESLESIAAGYGKTRENIRRWQNEALRLMVNA